MFNGTEPLQPFWISDQHNFNLFRSKSHPVATEQVLAQCHQRFGKRCRKLIFKICGGHLGFSISSFSYFMSTKYPKERCGAVVKCRTRDRQVPGSIPTNSKCCFLEQETLSTLLSTGFYPGKKRATWKISARLLNVLPSINKVDYYYYYY